MTRRAQVKPDTLRKIAFLPDTHRPYHDKRAWAAALAALRGWRPDVLVHLGDYADFFALSFHEREPKRKRDVQWELDDCNAGLDELDELKVPVKHFVMGNHEHRWNRYLANAASPLEGIRSLSLEAQLQLKERGWRVTPYKQALQLGKLLISHDFDRAGRQAHSQAITDTMANAVIGHTHGLGITYQGSAVGKSHVGAVFGWLGDVKAIDYRHRARAFRDWHLGFGTGLMESNGTTHLQAIPIIDGRCVVGGKLYRG